MSNNEGSRRHFLQTAAGVGAALPAWPMIGRSAEIVAPAEPNQSLRERGKPREPLRSSDYPDIASAIEQSLRFIIAEGVDTDFPRPFELQRLEQQPDLRAAVASLCMSYMTAPETIRDIAPLSVMLLPKTNMSGYRPCAHAELISSVLYLTCAILIARRIESSRSPVDAQREFSFRFKPQGSAIFDPECDYRAFSDRALAKLDTQTPSVLVNADIANFFPGISIGRLTATLHQHGVESWITDVLQIVLSEWTSQWPTGIPVGPTASYVLAEAALLNVDRRLESEGIDFIRYVDDYVLFAPNMVAAHHGLESLVASLTAEGLSLNGAKTSIEPFTRGGYEKYLNARRSGRFWGGLGLTGDAEMLVDGTRTRQEVAEDSPPPKKKKRPPPPTYAQSPFKTSQLSEFDITLLDHVDPASALSRLIKQVRDEKRVSLGQFRVFTEAACYHGDYAMLSRVFGILDHCQHCIPYLVDVLVTAGDEIPGNVRETARQWLVDRLNSNHSMSSFELMSVATLLASEGYRDPKAVFAYLQSSGGAGSPIVTRAFLTALSGDCNPERAKTLMDLGLHSDAFTRRAFFDLAWPYLEAEQRAGSLEMHRSEFERDPFLLHLLKTNDV
jgi:Reverse transcriptase (RNA-dependent DNA polymerase)